MQRNTSSHLPGFNGRRDVNYRNYYRDDESINDNWRSQTQDNNGYANQNTLDNSSNFEELSGGLYSLSTSSAFKAPSRLSHNSSYKNGHVGEDMPKKKESVREIFLRQVRGEVLPESLPAPSSKSNSVAAKASHVPAKPTPLPVKTEEPHAHQYSQLYDDAVIPKVPVVKIGKVKVIKPENRRDTLTDQLTRCAYECMVCCAKIYERQSIWNCQNCYNAFHLHCIKKWCDSSSVQGEWRCPGCQNIVNYYPKFYYCYCGKTKNPPYTCSGLPHSCGNSCGKKRSSGEDCSHLCALACHPGPCEVCTDMVNRTCCCGKSKAFVQCKSKAAVLCGKVCEKLLNCKVHKCQMLCHGGPCEDCEQNISLACYCGRNKKEVPCTTEANISFRPKYSCKLVCDKILNCKNHQCDSLCHPDRCSPCSTSIDVIVSCPCGQTSIEEACRKNGVKVRSSCKDPIPTCEKLCNKILPCGIFDQDRHKCVNKCHSETERPCSCPLVTVAPCRCGSQQIELPCSTYTPGMELTCQRRCTKKRSCGRHKCNQFCCIDQDHICTIVCGKSLSCGNHRCEQLCHNGHCRLCPNVSFEELRCECGNAVHYPPVPCGTPPPVCDQPCLRKHNCEHPVHHTCHSDETCPPCPFLTEKWCYGKHELRKNIPCWNNNVSCGMPCGKELKCGRHKCPRTCHSGDCEVEGTVCKLKCISKIKCGHACSAVCHKGPCPDVTCKELTEVTCPCGKRKEVMLCYKREAEFERIILEVATKEHNEMFECKADKLFEQDPSIVEFKNKIRATKSITVVLDCDKECARVERMKKIAEALQLHNPDPETRIGPPDFSDFLKKYALKSPQFVEMVHEKLTALVMETRKSKKKNNTYAFDSMNRDKRTLIHEYSDHFGCQSESFDEEPNRNVIVTASKDKCWLPSVSLIDVVFRKATVNKTERKNVYQDLELSEPPKSKILGPANKFKLK